MTVSELIAALELLPQDLPVEGVDHGADECFVVTSVGLSGLKLVAQLSLARESV